MYVRSPSSAQLFNVHHMSQGPGTNHWTIFSSVCKDPLLLRGMRIGMSVIMFLRLMFFFIYIYRMFYMFATVQVMNDTALLIHF